MREYVIKNNLWVWYYTLMGFDSKGRLVDAVVKRPGDGHLPEIEDDDE
jgi:hypothetical protein